MNDNKKACTKCLERKDPIDDFHVHSKAKSGRAAQCKACRNAYNAPRAVEWNRAHPARVKENHRKYRERKRAQRLAAAAAQE